MAGTIIADTIQATSQQISLNVGNTTILTASSTGLTLIPTTNVNINVTNSTATFGGGNVSRPSVSFTGNTSTGLYMPLANTVAWSIAGSERMRLTSNGYLAVGTDAVNTTGQVRQLTVSNNGTPEFVLRDTSQSADSRNWRMFNSSNSLYFGTLNDAGTSGTDVMILDSSGRARIPSQPSFRVGFSASSQTSGVIAWNNIDHNIGSYFNTGTYTFTAPVAGRYQFNVMCGSVRTASTGDFYVDLELNGTRTNRIYTAPSGGGQSIHNQASSSNVLNLAVGDAVRVTIASTPGTVGLLADRYHNIFSGHLLG